jgi:2-oxo-4-hydroxy-4-carboxy-5-ureidoimidazoline decarboxylase
MSTALAAFNDLSHEAAIEQLMRCCAAPAWAQRVAAGRPYADIASIMARAETASAALPWPQVELALAAHPRIGERATGDSAEASWSRLEQAAATGADQSTQARLAAANRAYEARFGHIYLVFAAGRSATELLGEAQRRLTNDPEHEQAEVRRELGRIAARRLGQLLAPGEPAA